MTMTGEPRYGRPFRRWDRTSWVRSKPVRSGDFEGLPFSPSLVPLASAPPFTSSIALRDRLLAYRLLAHLHFTTSLELCHINPVCAELGRGQGPVPLTEEQRNDALRIYCDEGAHALFVELLSRDVEQAFAVRRAVLGPPEFEGVLAELSARHADSLPRELIRCFFVTVSETLITRILTEVPRDPGVAPRVRAVIGDHAADEALHGAYFRWYFPLLWRTLDAPQRRAMTRVLPELLWAFLGPDTGWQLRALRDLGLGDDEARRAVERARDPDEIARCVRHAAQPTLRMFRAAGVLDEAFAEDTFAAQGLHLTGDGVAS